ncbi:hypothetical protein GEMRC1_010401 [Eukaryota sp. GEM-RC1]
MSPWLRCKESDDVSLPEKLALTSLQVISTSEPLINDPSLPDPLPSLAAGLPHFASGYMRNWGRDTFIALSGLCLVTGRYQEAKSLILGYARTLRHGLIPNLMSGGEGARYNARDATWFFLNSIINYVEQVPKGDSILKEKVPLIYSDDDAEPIVDSSQSRRILTLVDVIYEILARHAQGIHFRERNAGIKIDDRMQDEGFNIDIHLDLSTGFLFGGNRFNAGQWNDKMGSSAQSGNRGWPATPRDGACIECTVLLAKSLRFVIELSGKGRMRQGVKLSDGRFLTFIDWLETIKRTFEQKFWIPLDSKDDDSHEVDPKIVNRRGIYRDVVGPYHVWTSYQLRGNASVAIAMCPWLFNDDHARHHLKISSEVLLKPAMPGLKTLDPTDFVHRNFYSAADSDDFYTAEGFCYHNGPAWLWISGYHCLALLLFDKDGTHGLKKIAEETFASLASHVDENLYLGVAELLQGDGSFCEGSCATQAWSSAAFLEALDLQRRLSGGK